MALLKIFHKSQLWREVQLTVGEEYIIGRSEECQIILDPERGISRQHIKLSPNGTSWTVEVLSRFGELYVGREKVSSFELSEGFKFLVPPYEFEFSNHGATQAPVIQNTSAAEKDSVTSSNFDDRTFVGTLQSVPYLKVIDPQGNLFQIFRLEGQAWQAGRDTSCSLFVDHQKFSRKQFEIQFQEGAYLIKDLGSSNGTLHNGTLLSQDWTKLESGDVITVVDWTLQFELRDSSFEQRIQEIPEDLKAPAIYDPRENSPPGHLFAAPQSQYLKEGMAPPPTGFPPAYDPGMIGSVSVSPNQKTKIMRITMAVLILGAALFYFMNGDSSHGTSGSSVARGRNPFEKLSPQQQQYIKDTYRLADSLFKQGRYEMARQEISKIHQIIPYYEESKNIEQLANVAIQTQIDQQKAEAREQDRVEMEQKITQTVAECRKKLNPNSDVKQLDDCLGPVIALNPEHPLILAIKAEVDQITSNRVIRKEQKAEYQAALRKQKNLFEKAENAFSTGQALQALEAFQSVVKSPYPDPQDLKAKAKRQIASIKEKISDQQASFKKKSEAAYQKGDFKEAIINLQGALKIDPSNAEIKAKIDSDMKELKKSMQTLYQEGVLEESVGEVDIAKAKWKKIMDSSLPEEDYFKKAKIKLKKYGAL